MSDHYRRTVALLSQDFIPLDNQESGQRSGTVMIAGDVHFPQTDQTTEAQRSQSVTTAKPPDSSNRLTNTFLGTLVGAGLVGGTLGFVSYFMDDEAPPAPPPPAIKDRDTDTIGILEPDRNGDVPPAPPALEDN